MKCHTYTYIHMSIQNVRFIYSYWNSPTITVNLNPCKLIIIVCYKKFKSPKNSPLERNLNSFFLKQCFPSVRRARISLVVLSPSPNRLATGQHQLALRNTIETLSAFQSNPKESYQH